MILASISTSMEKTKAARAEAQRIAVSRKEVAK
jgi:hypothetical protein